MPHGVPEAIFRLLAWPAHPYCDPVPWGVMTMPGSGEQAERERRRRKLERKRDTDAAANTAKEGRLGGKT